MIPALIAPNSDAADALEELHFAPPLESLNSLGKQVVGPQSQGLNLSISVLKGDRAEEQWRDELTHLRAACEQWLERNQRVSLRYQPATAVWHQWLKEGEWLREGLDVLLNNQLDSKDKAFAAADACQDRRHVDSQIQRTDADLRGPAARRHAIHGPALQELRNKAAEAAQFLIRWAELLENAPNSHANWLVERVRQLRLGISEALASTRQQLTNARRASPLSLADDAAIGVVESAMDTLEKLVDPAAPSPPEPRPISHVVAEPVLCALSVSLDNEWLPEEPGAPEVLEAVLQNLEGSWPPAWVEVVNECWQAGKFSRAQQIFTLLGAEASAPAADNEAVNTNLAALRTEHDRLLADRRERLKQTKEHLATEIERARTLGEILEAARLELTSRLQVIAEDQALDIQAAEQTLEEIDADLRAYRDEAIEDFRKRTRESLAERDPDSRRRIEELLNTGDLITANEYMTILENGDPLPEQEATEEEKPFFPDFVSQIESMRRRPSASEVRLIRKVENRETIGPLRLSKSLTPNDAQRAAEALTAWRDLSHGLQDAEERLATLFRFLGIHIKSLERVEQEFGSSHTRFRLNTVPVANREDCVLPDFGSRADGHYTVVCLEDQPLEEQLLRETRVDHGRQSVIALYFGGMTSRRRRDLAHRLRSGGNRRLLVLDDLLLLYLCLQKRRPWAFFQAAAMFTPADPYTTTASLVPQEMFFGREREISSVIDPSGTNLVYGGRQLGKTALLRETVRRHHNPDQGVIVEWIDIKYGENLGLSRPISDIWAVIAGRLQQYSIVAPKVNRRERIEQGVMEWLDADASRRLVLLLDEADQFLEADGGMVTNDASSGSTWEYVGQLKTLMDRTNRRFKVVFAGLHNVQRTSHDVNTPLAHLGEPICIGPFTDGPEICEAVQMVRLPIEAMGYRFASSELVGRILAHTNFYPNLIQLFCKELIGHLSNPQKRTFDRLNSPPYLIERADIERAYTGESLRKSITDRFRWTLELDNRYRVIALLIAAHSVESPELGAEGFTLDGLRNQVLSIWPEGFAETATRDSFKTLLEEMVGLGVLRVINGNRYTLRSPNLLGLLGTETDIWSSLEDVLQHQPEIKYDSTAFRRAFSSQERWRRSPLTAAQESRLLERANGVIVLFGHEAAGLDDLQPFLEAQAREPGPAGFKLRWLDDVSEERQFDQQIESSLSSRDEGLLLLVVSPTCAWSDDWVEEAMGRIDRQQSKHRFAKVLFVADPARAMWWADIEAQRARSLEDRGLETLQLSQWSKMAVRRWNKEAEFGRDNEQDLKYFESATGNWGGLLVELGRRCAKAPANWQGEADAFRQELLAEPHQTLKRFGINDETAAVLTVLAEIDVAATPEELVDLEDSLPPPNVVERVFRWGELVYVLQPVGEGRLRLDPFVRSLLTTTATG